MNLQIFFRKAILFIAIASLTGCALGASAPEVSEIQATPSKTIMTGQKANLSVRVEGSPATYEWSAQHGKLDASSQPAVNYTAPDEPGFDTVTVRVKYDGGEIIRNITFEVVAPLTPATETPLPADTQTVTAPATPTAAPDPIACNHPAVTKNLFPQVENVNGQFPMYGPETEPNLLCEAVYDRVHTPGGMAVHIKYENVGTNFAWWGIAIKDPDSYDASQHSRLCFWVYAEQPNQAFRVKMKDKTRKEAGDVVTTELTGQWDEICTNISDFADAGIQVDRMDNVNLGFEQPSGSAEIWIADFEFK
jgi:hypothetical protein